MPSLAQGRVQVKDEKALLWAYLHLAGDGRTLGGEWAARPRLGHFRRGA
jgi:hypothetical protein